MPPSAGRGAGVFRRQIEKLHCPRGEQVVCRYSHAFAIPKFPSTVAYSLQKKSYSLLLQQMKAMQHASLQAQQTINVISDGEELMKTITLNIAPQCLVLNK